MFAVPPETRKASPAAPEIAPPFIVSVPSTFVRLMPFALLPLLVEETEVKVAPKVTPLAKMACPACAALPVALIVPVVTLIVPPPEATSPAPFEVVMPSEPKLMVAPVFVPPKLKPAPPAVVLVTVAPVAKLIVCPLPAF